MWGEKLIGRINYRKKEVNRAKKYRRERSRAKCLCRISLLTNQFKIFKLTFFRSILSPHPPQKLCGIAILIESIFLFFRLRREPFPKLSEHRFYERDRVHFFLVLIMLHEHEYTNTETN